jgi:transposase InsO family protein
MSWKFILYDWGGLNVALFQAINTCTPAAFAPLAWFFSFVGSYWTAAAMLLGLWWWSKSATDPARAPAVRASHAVMKATSFEYIKVFYNRKRQHSSLGYLSPVQFMEKWLSRQDQEKR